MAHSFKTYPGRPAFDVFGGCIDAGNYVRNKKARSSFCGANVCKQGRKVNTQSNLLLLNESIYLNNFSCGHINKTDLYVNLLQKLDLEGVAVIQNNNPPFNSPTDISASIPAYLNYTIDPCGNLFGNSSCGVYNYQYYLSYNPLVPNVEVNNNS